MLVLSRKYNETILIGDEVKVTIIRIGPNSVRVGIEAPKHLNIVRAELVEQGNTDERDSVEHERDIDPRGR